MRLRSRYHICKRHVQPAFGANTPLANISAARVPHPPARPIPLPGLTSTAPLKQHGSLQSARARRHKHPHAHTSANIRGRAHVISLAAAAPLSALIAGTATAVITNPFWLLKTRMQLDVGAASTATSAPGLGLTAATSAPGLDSPAATSAPGLDSPAATSAPGLDSLAATSAPGPGSPAATSAPGLGSPLPHICAGTRLTRCHIRTGFGAAGFPTGQLRFRCGALLCGSPWVTHSAENGSAGRAADVRGRRVRAHGMEGLPCGNHACRSLRNAPRCRRGRLRCARRFPTELRCCVAHGAVSHEAWYAVAGCVASSADSPRRYSLCRRAHCR